MLCLVTALAPEARPIIQRYKLKAVEGHPYRLYTGDDMRLIVSGMGKVAAGAAVAYQAALLEEPAAWLNVGVAGHASAEIGTALLAHKVVDRASGKSFYPIFTDTPQLPTTLLHTVDQPESAYVEEAAYDMEASGFCETALRFASGELVHCLKVVSDNPQFSWQEMNAKKIQQLIADQLDAIDTVGQGVADLARELADLQADPPEYDALLAHWRFTATQRHQLRGLLQRWQVLAPGQKMLDEELASVQDRGEVLAVIARRLREVDLILR